MATRSNIGIVNEDGSVTGIYCHWDGYPEYVGKILLNHYNNAGIINELMDLGDLSTLDKNLYCEDNNHSFNNPQPGVCVAYGRDRGEKNVGCKVFDNLTNSFESYAKKSGADFQYLFMNEKWHYRTLKSEWSELTPAVCK